MSKFPLAAVSKVLLLVVWGLGVSEAVSQESEGAKESETVQETEAPEGTPALASGAIGLLDVSRVLKSYPPFLDSIAEMKLDVEKAEEGLKQEKSELENLVAQLKIHPIGTDEHTTLEDRITTLKNELASSVARQKRDFLRREARVYHDAYREVVGQSEQYARQNGIVLVLRFSVEEANVNDPASVLKQINGPIVWYDKDRDITEAVLQRLIERSKEEEEGTRCR